MRGFNVDREMDDGFYCISAILEKARWDAGSDFDRNLCRLSTKRYFHATELVDGSWEWGEDADAQLARFDAQFLEGECNRLNDLENLLFAIIAGLEDEELYAFYID